MGPRSDVRDTMVKTGKEILMAMMCFLFVEIILLTTRSASESSFWQ